MVGAWHGHGMASVNQTRPHFVGQTDKTHSKPLVARNGRGTVWARHGNGMLCVNRPLLYVTRPRRLTILNQIKPLHASPIPLLEDTCNIILPPTPRSYKWTPSLWSPHQNPARMSPLTHTPTCPSHHILFDLINRILFGDKAPRNVAFSLPCHLVLLGPNIFLSNLFWNTLGLRSSL